MCPVKKDVVSSEHIVSEPPSPASLDNKEVCPFGIIPRCATKDHHGLVTAGSLLFLCQNSEDVWSAMVDSALGKTLDPLIVLSNRHCSGSSTKKCFHNLYSLVIHQFTHRSFASYISMANLQWLFGTQFKYDRVMNVDLPYTERPIENWVNVFSSLQKIAISVNDTTIEPSIETYQLITSEISLHPLWIQIILQDAIALRCGPLINLATNVTLANIYAFLDKLKLASSTEYVLKLFTSPSVMGKCAALFHLLEIHGFLWKRINWPSIESMIKIFYNVLTWLIETCKLGLGLLKSGYRWIKAKFRCGKDEENTYPTIGTDLPESEAKSQALVQNNCFFDAVADLVNLTPLEVREKVGAYCVTMEDHVISDILKKNGCELDIKKFKTDMIQKYTSQEMFDTDVIPFANRALDIYIVSISPTENIGYVDVTSDDTKEKIYIVNEGYHWRPLREKPSYDRLVSIFGLDVGENVIQQESAQDRTEKLELDKLVEILEKEDRDGFQEDSRPPIPEDAKPTIEETKRIVSEIEETETGRSFMKWLSDATGDTLTFFRDNPIVLGLMSFIFSIVTGVGMVFSKFSTARDKMSFWDKISMSSKDFYYLTRGKAAVTEVFGDFFRTVRGFIGIQDEPEVAAFKSQLADQTEKAEAMLSECQSCPGEFLNNPEKFHEFRKCMDQIKKQYKDLISLNPTVNVSVLAPIWQRLNSSYHSLLQLWIRTLNSRSIRVKPTCVWFWGETNLGKSDLMDHVWHKICERKGVAWDMFAISKGPEYLNGFGGQKGMKIDDFDTFTGPEGCVDALMVMNLVTTSPYNPNIAHLDDKMIMAEPKVFLVGSNYSTVRANSGVNDFRAFERRRHRVVNVTWPGHDSCRADEDSCEHWKAVRAKRDLNNIKSFDHLRLRVQSSLVLTHPSYDKHKKPKDYKSKDMFETRDITIDDLVTEIVANMEENEINYKLGIEQQKRVREMCVAKASGQAVIKNVKGKISTWVHPPNIALVGPPGTGKSSTLRACVEALGQKAHFIEHGESFNVFANANFVVAGKTHIIIDDISTLVSNVNLPKFWEAWKDRYDRGGPNDPIWIIGVNEKILRGFFAKEEIYDMNMRRCLRFEYIFRAKPGITNYLRSFVQSNLYNADDVRAGCLSGKCVDEFVQHIMFSESEALVTEASVVQRIARHQTEKVDYSIQTHLETITDLQHIDTYAGTMLTTEEFIGMINGTATSEQVITSMLEGEFRSEKHTKYEIGKRIYRCFKTMVHSYGTNYIDMDDFIIAGANSHFFDSFDDGTFVLSFTNKKYALLNISGKVEAFIYEPGESDNTLMNEIKKNVETVSKLDFLAVTCSSLPHWAMLTFDILKLIAAAAATSAVIAYDVKHNKLIGKAVAMYNNVLESTEKYVDTSLLNVAAKHEKALNPEECTQSIPVPIPTVTESSTTASDRSTNSKSRRPGIRIRARRPGQRANAQGVIHEDVRVVNISDVAETHAAHYVEEMTRNGNERAVEQVATDSEVYKVIGRIMKNFVDIVTTTGHHVIYGIMVHGDIGTTVAHVLKSYDPGELMVKTIDGTQFPMEKVFCDVAHDRFDFRITGKAVRQFPNISSTFHSHDDRSHKNRLAVLVNLIHDAKLSMPVLQVRFYKLVKYERCLVDDNNMVLTWSYVGNVTGYATEPPQTIVGDCGSIMLICDSGVNAKVVGMHMAANDKYGYIREITREQYIEAANSQARVKFNGTMHEFEEPKFETNKGYPVLARTTINPFCSDKSHIYKSPFQYGSTVYEPAVLSKRDPRLPEIDDMKFKEAMKWVGPRVQLSDEKKTDLVLKAREIGDYIGQKLAVHGVSTRVLTKREALNKVKGYAHSQPIARDTSSGYPWSQLVRNGKKEFIDILPDGSRVFGKDKRLLAYLHRAIDDILKKAEKEQSADVAFWCILKDELLKETKLSKTRTIAAAPLHFVIAARMYFHTIYAAIAELWHVLPIKIGIAPNTLDWHTLTVQLLKVGTQGFSLDYRDFDFYYHPFLHVCVVEMMNVIAHLTDEYWDCQDDIVRRGIHKVLDHPKIIVHNLVYEAQGQMSGHPGTAPENSLGGLLIVYDAWCSLCPVAGYCNFETFMLLVSSAVYGDDYMATVDPECLQWFNAVTISEYVMKTFGMTMTGQDKLDTIRPYDHISRLTFLSRGFSQLNGFYVGPLKMERLMKPFHYTYGSRAHDWYADRNSLTPELENATDAARSGLEEMFLHGEKEYERCRSHIIRVCAQYGLTEEYYPTYAVAFANYFNCKPSERVPLSVFVLNTDHSIITKLSQEKGWFRYENRRCIKFGKEYFWDSKSKGNPSKPIPLFLKGILQRVNIYLERDFNEILVNEYAPGGEIPYHQDKEEGVCLDHGVASITLCGDGIMEWKYAGKSVYKLECYPDLMYLMKGKFVNDYYHSRHSHKKYTITLTFRKIDS